MKYLRVSIVGLLFLAMVGGCASRGHKKVAGDRFDYNSAILQSRSEQMLLNIIRLRYQELPNFLAVSSVITSYVYEGSIGASGSANIDGPLSSVGGAANLAYSERPTISYSPLDGQDFSRRMLKRIPVDVIFALGQMGWPMDILFAIALQRINNLENMGFGGIPAPGDLDRDKQFREEKRKLIRYQRALKLLLILGQSRAIEVHRVGKKGAESSILQFSKKVSPKEAVYLKELKKLLQLDPKTMKFRITDRMTGRDSDEVTILSRSLLAIMSFLAHSIDIPIGDKEKGVVVVFPTDVDSEIRKRLPMRIQSQTSRPTDPYVAVKYRGYWFYIDHTDIPSKRTFSTVEALFQLQAPSGGNTAPLLTLPAG